MINSSWTWRDMLKLTFNQQQLSLQWNCVLFISLWLCKRIGWSPSALLNKTVICDWHGLVLEWMMDYAFEGFASTMLLPLIRRYRKRFAVLLYRIQFRSLYMCIHWLTRLLWRKVVFHRHSYLPFCMRHTWKWLKMSVQSTWRNIQFWITTRKDEKKIDKCWNKYKSLNGNTKK